MKKTSHRYAKAILAIIVITSVLLVGTSKNAFSAEKKPVLVPTAKLGEKAASLKGLKGAPKCLKMRHSGPKWVNIKIESRCIKRVLSPGPAILVEWMIYLKR